MLGFSTILDLLDAQSQLLDAEIALVDSTYGFLEDLIAEIARSPSMPFWSHRQRSMPYWTNSRESSGLSPNMMPRIRRRFACTNR